MEALEPLDLTGWQRALSPKIQAQAPRMVSKAEDSSMRRGSTSNLHNPSAGFCRRNTWTVNRRTSVCGLARARSKGLVAGEPITRS